MDLGNEIADMKNFKKDLENNGLTAFLTTEIETNFDHLLDFLYKSVNASEIRYGINEQYYAFGQEKSFYRVLPNGMVIKGLFFTKYSFHY